MNVPGSANTQMYDRDLGVIVINETDIETSSVRNALATQAPEVAALVRWSIQTRGDLGRAREGSIFQRDRFVTPTQIFAQFDVAQDAANSDDVVSGVLEGTEALAFGRISFSSEDEDEEDIWNQIGLDIDLDSRIREMWRELFTFSQFYMVTWWDKTSYKVRGRSDQGVKRKKSYDNLTVPTGLSLLDPKKVVPIGNLMFNQEQLAYIADRTEVDTLDAAVLNDPEADPVSRAIIVAKYAPPDYERRNLAKLGINSEWLYILNPRYVWRHTLTRPQYQRFADVRMRSIFEMLDLKQQLHQMDRATLIGGPLAYNTPVATLDGWVNIGSLKAGDEVIAVDGTPTTVTGVYPQGELEMYEVTFTDGTSVFCDASHGWTVRAPKGQWRKISLAQIMAEGIMQPNGVGASGRPQRRYRHEVLLSEPWQLPEVDYLLDPYLMGYLLGDGNFDGTPSIACAEDEHPWEEVLPEDVRVVQNRANPYDWCLSRVLHGRQPQGSGLRGNPIKAALKKLNLWGVHCRDKFIPEEYLWGSIEQRWALLQGLCDSDGSAHVGGAMFGNASGKLVEDVCQLVQSLGGLATKHNYPNEGGDFWQVQIQFNGDRCPFRLARKVAAWSPRKRQTLKRCIASIKHRGPDQAVCIHVEHPSHVFMTQHGIASNNTNFIVLIKKGTDNHPARPEEITNLQNQVRSVAQVPVLVGDHRLAVEIVTPKNDHTLNNEKYSVIDSRITTRLYQMFLVHGGTGMPRSDDSVKLAKVIARGLEARRYMLKRTFERKVLGPALAANPALTTEPTLRFHPSRIELDFDNAIVQFIMDLRDRGDLSRETVLSELDFDQEAEAIRRQREARDYDDIFAPTNIPWGSTSTLQGPGAYKDAPTTGAPAKAPSNKSGAGTDKGTGATAPVSPRSAGRNTGGNRNGGGAAPGSGQGKAPRTGRPKNT